MRKILFALIALAAIPALQATPAQAAERRFCIAEASRKGAGPLSCQFDTFAQCQATASGQAATCSENPLYAGQSYGQYREPGRRYSR